ncbi:MAG: tetratricopeptide repeat protein [Chitinivibrionia bacterium]|nr:tetratricopeptide repeat protein [Chitinivibrionia bacterium]
MKFIIYIILIAAISFADELKTLTDKGISALKKGDGEKALEYFNEAVEKYPASNEAKFNKGLLLAATGDVKQSDEILSQIKFDKNEKNINALNLRAKIAETVGDFSMANEQQPNISQAKTAYQKARSFYAEALDLNPKNKKQKDYFQLRIENLSKKIRELPENQDEQNENEQNKDDKNDKKKDNKDEQNKDNKENNDDKDEQNKDEQNEQQQNEQNKEDENEEQKQNEQNEQEQQKEQNEEKMKDAVRLLEHYADDAKELNKPPLQKEIPTEKDW